MTILQERRRPYLYVFLMQEEKKKERYIFLKDELPISGIGGKSFSFFFERRRSKKTYSHFCFT
jgi:hypothetical protein